MYTIGMQARVLGVAAAILCLPALGSAQFDDPASWAAFDAGDNGVGSDPDGYFGGAFDGRYVYFSPAHNGTTYHCEVLRHDTHGDLGDVSSWSAFDPRVAGLAGNPRGYFGAVFDGRYVYFVPHRRWNDFHAVVLRYDTNGAFGQLSSWAAFDPEPHVGTTVGGYMGAIYDGRYVYFAPNYHGGSYDHGEVLRLDTRGTFDSAASWATFDPGSNGVGTDPDGYSGGVFDGRYVYFAPLHNGTDWHGEVLRYDTDAPFAQASSWQAYDPGASGVGDDPDGYSGAVFDGRYVYFSPFLNGTEHHGEVLRYDTQASFTQASSWATFDAGDQGVGDDPDGFLGAVFDGQYVYFAGDYNGSGFHSEELRYDTTASFDNPASWSAYDPTDDGVGTHPASFAEAVFDGRYIYFVPNHDSQQYGEVMRYDTGLPTPIPLLPGWTLAALLVVMGVSGVLLIRRSARREAS